MLKIQPFTQTESRIIGMVAYSKQVGAYLWKESVYGNDVELLPQASAETQKEAYKLWKNDGAWPQT